MCDTCGCNNADSRYTVTKPEDIGSRNHSHASDQDSHEHKHGDEHNHDHPHNHSPDPGELTRLRVKIFLA